MRRIFREIRTDGLAERAFEEVAAERHEPGFNQVMFWRVMFW